MSAPLILTLMSACFLAFGYLGVPVPFALLAGVFVGAVLADVSLAAILQKVFDGVDNEAAKHGPGDDHMKGMGCMLTGTELLPGTTQGGCCEPAGLAALRALMILFVYVPLAMAAAFTMLIIVGTLIAAAVA